MHSVEEIHCNNLCKDLCEQDPETITLAIQVGQYTCTIILWTCITIFMIVIIKYVIKTTRHAIQFLITNVINE